MKEYDYANCAAYFITICAAERSTVLGEIKSGKLCLLTPGKIAEKWLLKIPEKFETAKMGEYVIMPDHLHAIIFIVGGDPRVAPCNDDAPNHSNPRVDHNKSEGRIVSLPRIIQWFKTMSTNECIRWKKENAIGARKKPLWQRSFYDHIIRNEHDQYLISKYISENTLKLIYDRMGNCE